MQAPEDTSKSTGTHKTKKGTKRKIIVALVWVAAIVAIAFAVLFLASKIGQFDSIGDMIAYIMEQV